MPLPSDWLFLAIAPNQPIKHNKHTLKGATKRYTVNFLTTVNHLWPPTYAEIIHDIYKLMSYLWPIGIYDHLPMYKQDGSNEQVRRILADIQQLFAP